MPIDFILEMLEATIDTAYYRKYRRHSDTPLVQFQNRFDRLKKKMQLEYLPNYRIIIKHSEDIEIPNEIIPGIENEYLIGRTFQLTEKKYDELSIINNLAEWGYKFVELSPQLRIYPDFLHEIERYVEIYLPLIYQHKIQIELEIKPENEQDLSKIPARNRKLRIKSGSKFCSQCKQISKNAEKFCPKCGHEYGF